MMKLSERQKKIIEIVKESEPISGDRIAKMLHLTKPTLRSDLAVLTMTGILDARPKVGYFYSGQSAEPLLYGSLFRKTVEDVMVQPTFIKPDTPINDAIAELFLMDVGSLYVLDEEERLIGLVSRKDLLRAAINHRVGEASSPAAMVMTRMPNIITVVPQEDILDAGYLLIKHQVDSLPVVSVGDGEEVVGKFSKSTLLRYFIEEGARLHGGHIE